MSTPREQLRTAAETLRTMAGAATPPPWWTSHDKPSPHRPEYAYDVTGPDGYGPDVHGLFHDMQFIALMDPTMAGLVADWLEAVARAIDALPEHADNPQAWSVSAAALALAEHINGRTS